MLRRDGLTPESGELSRFEGEPPLRIGCGIRSLSNTDVHRGVVTKSSREGRKLVAIRASADGPRLLSTRDGPIRPLLLVDSTLFSVSCHQDEDD